jgi:hypothetical protein
MRQEDRHTVNELKDRKKIDINHLLQPYKEFSKPIHKPKFPKEYNVR